MHEPSHRHRLSIEMPRFQFNKSSLGPVLSQVRASHFLSVLLGECHRDCKVRFESAALVLLLAWNREGTFCLA